MNKLPRVWLNSLSFSTPTAEKKKKSQLFSFSTNYIFCIFFMVLVFCVEKSGVNNSVMPNLMIYINISFQEVVTMVKHFFSISAVLQNIYNKNIKEPFLFNYFILHRIASSLLMGALGLKPWGTALFGLKCWGKLQIHALNRWSHMALVMTTTLKNLQGLQTRLSDPKRTSHAGRQGHTKG